MHSLSRLSHVSSAFKYPNGDSALSSEVTAFDRLFMHEHLGLASLCFIIGKNQKSNEAGSGLLVVWVRIWKVYSFTSDTVTLAL